ncbi:MAG: hypothetical protein DCC88_00240 [Spirobacillus cienkowskii]|uniref:Uncharacterized protein n=1 Tax=Spirobacillus cienkowskii TaxID=495820 RepID=A0A369KRT3_9BACT|nr:MAG: hypothetical protein DCC88_00240 [Spirobacillus cienkowskii]
MSTNEKKFYQMRLSDSLENQDILNFIKYAKTSFDSSKINYPRGLKSQADRAIWLMNYALEILSKNNKVEGASVLKSIEKEDKNSKNGLFDLLR